MSDANLSWSTCVSSPADTPSKDSRCSFDRSSGAFQTTFSGDEYQQSHDRHSNKNCRERDILARLRDPNDVLGMKIQQLFEAKIASAEYIWLDRDKCDTKCKIALKKSTKKNATKTKKILKKNVFE